MSPADWRRLVAQSLTLPRSAARRVLGAPVATGQWVALAALALILGTLLAGVARALLPVAGNPVAQALASAPLLTTLLQFALYLGISWVIAAIGRAFGGHGDLAGALALMAWLQVMMLLLQMAQLVVLLVLPLLGAMAGAAVAVWFFWALSAFIAELHGFAGLLKVLGGVLICGGTILFAVSALVALTGVPLPEMN